MGVKLAAASGGSIELVPTNTASAFTVTVPAVTATVLTDSAGILNIGSGQIYKDASGNVGIGTTSLTEKFEVNGAINASTTSANNFSTGTQRAFMDYTSGTTTARFGHLSGASGSTTGVMAMFTNGTERARIDSSGNLLVGATSGSAQLVVKYTYPKDGANWISSSSATHTAISFNTPAGVAGTINTNTLSTTYNTSSDYRLKEAIAPMTGALAKVALLKPCTYKWKVDGSDGQGFIAHELQEVVEGCVTGTKDATREQAYEVTPAVKDADGNVVTEAVMGTRTVPLYQGIDTSFLVATLTAAIQEQQALIVQLQADVAALKGAQA